MNGGHLRTSFPLGGEPRTGDRPVHVAVEPFLGASKAVHAGKAEEVEDEARGSAMLAVYPCPRVRSCPHPTGISRSVFKLARFAEVLAGSADANPPSRVQGALSISS